MQPIRTILTILVEVHSGTIPIEFGQNPMRKKLFKIVDTWMDAYNGPPQKLNLSTLCSGELKIGTGGDIFVTLVRIYSLD